MGIVYHYLALALPRRRKQYYELARRYLEQAVAFAGPMEKPRNQIMLAEALSILATYSHAEEDEYGMAIEKANLAAKIAIGIPQLECQANLALGAIYHLKAKKEPVEGRSEAIQKSRFYVLRALEINEGNNARIKAASYLRMTGLSLLEYNRYNPDAFYYYNQYLKVKDSVQHDYLQKWGERMELKSSTLMSICLLMKTSH